jgi:hypothetical protein
MMERTRNSLVLGEAQQGVRRNRQTGNCGNHWQRSPGQLGRFAGENQASDRWLALIRQQNTNYSFPAPRVSS